MSRREQALSVLHRLRTLQQSQQALEHARAQQDEHACQQAVQRACADLAAAQAQAGEVNPGGTLSLERDRVVAHLLGELQRCVQLRETEHREAVQRRDAAAQAHLAAQQQCDHVHECLNAERMQAQQQRDLLAHDHSSDLRLARLLSGGRA